MLFINPSIVKMFKEEVSTDIVEFMLVIKEEKHILWLNKSSPILRIKSEILDIKSINNSIIKNKEFIQIAYNTILIKKLEGLSILS